MMTCRDVYSFLDDFLDDRLDPLTRLSFSSHLLLCRACRNYLASYKTALTVARDAERVDAALEEVPEQLVRAILASRVTAFARQPPE